MPLYPTQWTFKCWEQKPILINLLNVCKNIGAYSPTVLYTIAYTAIKSMHSICGVAEHCHMYLLTWLWTFIMSLTENYSLLLSRPRLWLPVFLSCCLFFLFSPCVSFLPCCVCACEKDSAWERLPATLRFFLSAANYSSLNTNVSCSK